MDRSYLRFDLRVLPGFGIQMVVDAIQLLLNVAFVALSLAVGWLMSVFRSLNS